MQATNYTLTVSRHGTVSVGQVNTSTPAFETVLAQDDITRSGVYLNAACLTVSLNTTGDLVGAFVSTYDDFTSMSRQASHCHLPSDVTFLKASCHHRLAPAQCIGNLHTAMILQVTWPRTHRVSAVPTALI